jgi:APA family basic amino acid/polyamine antiporter
LSYAELSTTIPKAAAEYSYVKATFSNDLASFLVGWMTIITGIVASSAVALAFAGYLNGMIGTPIISVSIFLIFTLSIINYMGIEESNWLNILFTSIEAIGLLVIVSLGLPRLGSVNYFDLSNGISGVLRGSALIFFAYIGFEDIANLAEEAEKPSRDMPRAVILSVLVTAILYVFVALSVVNLANYNDLASSNSPLAYAASKALGSKAFHFISIIALFSTSNTVLILLIVNSRMIFGMARDRRLPLKLSHVSRRGTPTLAIILVMLSSSAFTLFGDLGQVAEITNLGTFITFLSVNLSALWLRYKKPDMERPFKTPFEIKKIAVVPLIGLISTGLLMTQISISILLIGVLTIGIGIIIQRISNEH